MNAATAFIVAWAGLLLVGLLLIGATSLAEWYLRRQDVEE